MISIEYTDVRERFIILRRRVCEEMNRVWEGCVYVMKRKLQMYEIDNREWNGPL